MQRHRRHRRRQLCLEMRWSDQAIAKADLRGNSPDQLSFRMLPAAQGLHARLLIDSLSPAVSAAFARVSELRRILRDERSTNHGQATPLPDPANATESGAATGDGGGSESGEGEAGGSDGADRSSGGSTGGGGGGDGAGGNPAAAAPAAVPPPPPPANAAAAAVDSALELLGRLQHGRLTVEGGAGVREPAIRGMLGHAASLLQVSFRPHPCPLPRSHLFSTNLRNRCSVAQAAP